MNTTIGNFKIYDLVEKCIVENDVAITSNNDIATVSKFEEIQEGLFLRAIGRRDRYVLIPEVPFNDIASGAPLYSGDILSNGKNNWVIKFDLVRGVFCTMIEFPDAYNRLEALQEFGFERIGSIFSNPELLTDREIEVFL
ncbi:hypothetical protein [Paenibacillus oralis]|nr:hypothetical protein [Paenibacillus oralis]